MAVPYPPPRLDVYIHRKVFKDNTVVEWDKLSVSDYEHKVLVNSPNLAALDEFTKAHDIKYKVYRDPLTQAIETAGAKVNSGGTKHDQDKLPLDLLDPQALEGLAAVLAFGAKKYAPNNWRAGFNYTRLIGALLRHTFALMRGERIDPESGLPHIDHIGCCWMFLSNMMKTRPDLDDLPKEERKLPTT